MAQELNLERLGSDAGIARGTVASWLSVLESSFLVMRIPRLVVERPQASGEGSEAPPG